METRRVYLGLGTNLGHRELMLGRAVRSLMDHGPASRAPILTDIRVSPIYETDPVGKTDQPPFLNAVVEGRTSYGPVELLAAVKQIEHELGREPRERFGPREIDIDLLHLDGLTHGPDPILPHPACYERAFVLAPLADLAPDLVMPGQTQSVQERLRHLPAQGVRRAYHQWSTHPPDHTRDLIPTIRGNGHGGLGEITSDVLQAIREGFSRVGAVRVENAIPPILVERLLKEAGEAFALPDEIKQRSYRSPTRAGYTPPGIENVRGHAPDQLRHFWDHDQSRLYGHEEEVARFYTFADIVFCHLRDLSYDLFQAFDHEFRTWIYRAAQQGMHLLRVSQYLNEQASPWEILFPSHQDFGLLTSYVGGAADGLQVKVDGVWYDLWNPPGSIVFGVGSTLKMYAPDRLTALPHRVSAAKTGRLSAVLFTEPRGDVVLPNGKTATVHLEEWMTKIRREPSP